MLDELMQLLMDLYLSGQLSVSAKTRSLTTLSALCKRAAALSLAPTSTTASASYQLRFRFRYQPLWQDIMAIIGRLDRDKAVASEHLLSELLTAQLELLHGARNFLLTTDTDADTDGDRDGDCDCGDGGVSTAGMEDGRGGYAVPRSNSPEALVAAAMAKVGDLRYPACIEGVLLLYNCLPTAYGGYDRLLPRWVEAWVGGKPR
jgi:hypothetical protein